MVPSERQVRIDADLDQLAGVRAVVREAATACAAPTVCIDDLVQAVDEAATNVIVHGYRGSKGWLSVHARQRGNSIVVTLEDEAPTFDPTTVPEPDLAVPPADRRPGGMGVHLMRLAMDDVRHAPRPGGGNILTMERRLDPRPKEDR